jgi:hypothetical protein
MDTDSVAQGINKYPSTKDPSIGATIPTFMQPVRPGPDDSRLITPETTPHLQLQPPPRPHIALFSMFVTIALLLVGFGAGVWLGREALFRGLTDLWIVSDPATRGDAAVVLGGGLEYRPFVAADLYKKGLVSKVLVSRAPGGTSAHR